MSQSFWRILDANLNRCNEGLRVLEDWCRFVADDQPLSQRLKDIRHHLQQASAPWPIASLLQARDSMGDVGRENTTATEHVRQDDQALLQANFCRVQQSLRVMEETAKRLEQPSQLLEALRYQAYDLHRDVLLKLLGKSSQHLTPPTTTFPTTSESEGERRRNLLKSAQLYVLTDLKGGLKSLEKHLHGLIEGGAQVIQLRDKTAEDRDLLNASVMSASVCRAAGVLFIVNDRPDLAVAAGADGVHVGQEELPVAVVRQLVGEHRLVGLSTHDSSQVTEALACPCDYLGVGPVFGSQTKSFKQHVGTALLEQVSGSITKPAFAIGGIQEDNLEQVLATGFNRIAVQGGAGHGDTLVPQTRRLREMLSRD